MDSLDSLTSLSGSPQSAESGGVDPIQAFEGMLRDEIGSAGCCCCSVETRWVPDDNTEELMNACRVSFSILPLYLSVHREAQTEIGFDGQH